MDIQTWKRLRREILKIEPLKRIKKLQKILKKVKDPRIIDDIIAILRRTTIELDVGQHQQGGTFFQPSRLEMIQRRDEPRADVEEKVEFVPVKREEKPVKRDEETTGYEGSDYASQGYFGEVEKTYKREEMKEFEPASEEFLSEGFDSNTRKYKRREKEEDENSGY